VLSHCLPEYERSAELSSGPVDHALSPGQSAIPSGHATCRVPKYLEDVLVGHARASPYECTSDARGGTSEPGSFTAGAGAGEPIFAHHHAVQFYDNEAFLATSCVSF
jgi:hypothetical protein